MNKEMTINLFYTKMKHIGAMFLYQVTENTISSILLVIIINTTNNKKYVCNNSGR